MNSASRLIKTSQITQNEVARVVSFLRHYLTNVAFNVFVLDILPGLDSAAIADGLLTSPTFNLVRLVHLHDCW